MSLKALVLVTIIEILQINKERQDPCAQQLVQDHNNNNNKKKKIKKNSRMPGLTLSDTIRPPCIHLVCIILPKKNTLNHQQPIICGP